MAAVQTSDKKLDGAGLNTLWGLIKGIVPTKTSDITNDSNFVVDASYVHTDNNFATALKNKLDGIASGATAVYENTVSAWGFTKNAAKKVKIGAQGNEYTADANNVITIPAYPTSLPASDVYAWAKASTKPSYTLDEVSDGSTRKLSNYLPLAGGTLSNINDVLKIASSNSNVWIYFKSTISNTLANRASIGYYNNFACIANEVTYARIGVNDAGAPQYWSNAQSSTAKTLWHEGNDGSGSGLDADLLDGQHGSYYAAATSLSNYLPLTGGTLTGNLTGTTVYADLEQARVIAINHHKDNFGASDIRGAITYTRELMPSQCVTPLDRGFGIYMSAYNVASWSKFVLSALDGIYLDNTTYVSGGNTQMIFTGSGSYSTIRFTDSVGNWRIFGIKADSDLFVTPKNNWNSEHIIWHSGNDGSGSGLDADLLDGKHASAFAPASVFVCNTGGAVKYYKISNLWNTEIYASNVYIISARRGESYYVTCGRNDSNFNVPIIKKIYGGYGKIESFAYYSDSFYIKVGLYSNVIHIEQIVGVSAAISVSEVSQSEYESATVITVDNNWDSSNTYVSNGKGYIGDTEITKVSQLATARSLWGQSFDGSADISGNIHLFSTGSGWCEGIRMHVAPNNWCGLVMCGDDNTGATGTSAKTWGVHNHNGTFWINKNGSDSHTGYEICNVDGNWGIATITPSEKLHVNGNVKINGTLTGATSIDGLMHFDTTNNYVGIGVSSPSSALDVNGKVTINNENGYAIEAYGQLRINASTDSTSHPQRVILGCFNGTGENLAYQPFIRFKGSDGVTREVLYYNSSNELLFGDQSKAVYISGANVNLYSRTTDGTSVQTALRAISGGRVCIGDVTSSYLGTVNSGYQIIVRGKACIDGDMGVGVLAAPSYKLHVNGAVGATAFTNTSDVRSKNIIDDKAVKVKEIADAPLFRFTWKDARMGTDVCVGSSAQYWLTILPELVTTAHDDIGTLSMQYGTIALASAICIARKVESQEEKIARLEARVKELEDAQVN